MILPILKKNLRNLKSIKNYSVIEEDILSNINKKITMKKYDIIFLDPPYKESRFINLIISMLNDQILKLMV